MDNKSCISERYLLFYKPFISCNLYSRDDKFSAQTSRLVSALIHKVHTAKTRDLGEVEVWGDVAARREFMNAGDLADAIGRSLDSFEAFSHIMNIGIGNICIDCAHCVCSTRRPEKYLAAADIPCVASSREGFGLLVIEAADASLPCVASKIYGITDAVIDDVTGLPVPAQHVHACAQAMAKLVKRPDLRDNMAPRTTY